jgi:hypothetical protein
VQGNHLGSGHAWGDVEAGEKLKRGIFDISLMMGMETVDTWNGLKITR